MGDAHEGIIDRVDQRVQGCAVGARHHVVGLGAGFEADVATHEVGPFPIVVGHAQTPHGFAPFGLEGRNLVGGKFAVVIIVA